MDFLPLFFDLKNKEVLVVGGGEVALRKATLLAKAHGRITVVSHEIRDDLTALVH